MRNPKLDSPKKKCMQAIKSENIEIEWLIIESFKTIRKVSIAFSQTPPEIFRSEKNEDIEFL